MRRASIVASLTVLVMVAASLGVAMGNASADQGSRDSYGYRWTDSNAPNPSVAFDWVEINATGTDTGLYGTFDESGALPIGFSFDFYGTAYTTFYVNTNGFISFYSGNAYEWHNDMIPYWSGPDTLIAPYWDYGENYYGTIYYETIGSAPDRQLVVEWENVSTIYTGSLLTYEVILNETGDMWFQYLEVGTDYGSDATVGIEDSTGDIGVQYSYENTMLSDSLAIRFSTGPVTITPSQTGVGKFGATVSYTLTVTNWQAASDTFDITYSSDLGWTVGLYDSLSNPLTDTDGNTVPDTGSVAAGSTVDIIVTVDIPASPAGYQELTTVNATSYASAASNDSCVLTTNVVSAWFTPPHVDVGLDPTGDGDFDVLSLNASIYARLAGWYYVYAYLHTSSELSISSDGAWYYLSVGTTSVHLEFYGWNIRESALNGPYHAHLTLEDNWNVVQDTGIHTTAAYLYTDFMLRPGTLSTPHDDWAEDTDADGLYDLLYINATVVANYDWRFEVEVDLYDSAYNYIGSATTVVDLVAGTRSVPLTFDAWDISDVGVDGVFHAYIYLYPYFEGYTLYMGSSSHTTGSYAMADFERRALIFTAPFGDWAHDTDSDGYFNVLQINATVDVAVEGDYSISCAISWYSGATPIDTESFVQHFTVGVHTVNFYFPGWPIYYSDDWDDIECLLEARSGSVLVDTYEYTTADWYYYWDFETAPGQFSPTPTSRAVDNDADGLYEFLVAEIPVTVEEAGYFEVTATDERVGDIETKSNLTYLDVGTTTVEIWFTGWMIRNHGWSGQIYIYMYLYDSEGREMDYDSFYTISYAYTAFDYIPAQFGTPNEAYVADVDSDGYFDAVYVNATVVVDEAGTYLVQGYLDDSSWNTVVSAGTWATLSVGTHVVQLAFPAWMINAHGTDGVFYVELELYDVNRNEMDYTWFTTSSYTNESFDPTVPRIDSSFTSSPPTIDGSYATGEWADATQVSLSSADTRNTAYGTMLVMNDNTNLYIMYDAYGDTHSDYYDVSSVAFDTGNDGIRTNGHEDAFLVGDYGGSTTEHYTFNSATSSWSTHCGPFDAVQPEHTTLAGAAGFGPSDSHAVDHRIYEYSIPLTLLDAAPGDVLGFLGRSWSYNGLYDEFNSTSSSWPVRYDTAPTITQYGELGLAMGTIILPPPVTTATASGTPGSAGWFKSQVSVSLSATGGDGGVDYTQYRLDGGSWTTYTAAIQITGQGTHSFEYRSVDMSAQVEATKTLTVKIDSGLPTTASAVSGALLWLNSTDASSGIASVMFRVDSGSWIVYMGVLNMTTYGVGTHIVDFYGVDSAGNAELQQSVSVVVEEGTGGSPDGPGILSGVFVWIGLLAAAIVAALVVLLLLVKRKKGQQPVQPYPTAEVMMQPQQLPPPPQA